MPDSSGSVSSLRVQHSSSGRLRSLGILRHECQILWRIPNLGERFPRLRVKQTRKLGDERDLQTDFSLARISGARSRTGLWGRRVWDEARVFSWARALRG